MRQTQHSRRGFQRRIAMVLASCLFILATATRAAAQCAYPALELLEFSYVNRRHSCLISPGQRAESNGERSANVTYEFEARLYVIDTLLRWLNLDATAEAWTSLPSSPPSEQLPPRQPSSSECFHLDYAWGWR